MSCLIAIFIFIAILIVAYFVLCGMGILFTDKGEPGAYTRKKYPLHYAIVTGEMEEAERLLNEGADVNASEESCYKMTPLHRAVAFDQILTSGLLLSKGADINKKDEFGMTPVNFAAFMGKMDFVGFFISHGADLNIMDNYNRTPLFYAVRGGFRKMADMIRQGGGDAEYFEFDASRLIYSAACVGDLEKVKLYIRNNPYMLNMRDTFDFTPLHWAAIDGFHISILPVRDKNIYKSWGGGRSYIKPRPITGGAVIIEDEKKGEFMFDKYYMKGDSYGSSEAVIEFLISRGAEINPKNYFGWTPCRIARMRGNIRLAKLLEKHGGTDGEEEAGN